MTTEWPRSIRPDQRRPAQWNAALDELASTYRGLTDQDTLIGVYVRVIDGDGEGWLLVRGADGEVRRIPAGENEDAA